jgi:histone H3/H4
MSGLARGRLSLAESDIRPGALVDDAEDTFVFTVPPRDVPDLQRSDDTVESPNIDDGENNDWGDMNAAPDEDAGDGWDAVQGDGDVSMLETTLQDADTTILQKHKAAKKKRIKISKHGIQYPSLPSGVVKKLATTYARTSGNGKAKISKDTLDAIMQASDWFFEQVSDDLGAYAQHAGRKTIEESDVITLMGRYASPVPQDGHISNSTRYRQRQINAATTPFSLAQKFLPRELLQELRMAPPTKVKRGRHLAQVDMVEEDTE